MDEARGNKGGSGLGLTIADRIIKAHDGKLELINLADKYPNNSYKKYLQSILEI